MLYVGQVYWLHAEIKAARAIKATIFFIRGDFGSKQKYNSLRTKQIRLTPSIKETLRIHALDQ